MSEQVLFPCAWGSQPKGGKRGTHRSVWKSAQAQQRAQQRVILEPRRLLLTLIGRKVPTRQSRQRRRDQFDLAQALHRLQDVPPARSRVRARGGTATDVELVREEVRVPARKEREEDLVQAAFVVVTRRGSEADREVVQESRNVSELEASGGDRRRIRDEKRFEFERAERLAAIDTIRSRVSSSSGT